MPPEAGLATATRFAASPSHAFVTDPARALSILVELPQREIQRGEPFSARIRLQNTGAGHHVPTGSPFKRYRVTVSLLDPTGKALATPFTRDLHREVEGSPPWKTLSDNRIPAGGELLVEPAFTVPQKEPAHQGLLRVDVRRVVGDDVSEPLVVQDIPLPVL